MNKDKHTHYPMFRAAKTDLFLRCDRILDDLKGLFPEMASKIDYAWMIEKLALCRRIFEAEVHKTNVHYGRAKPDNWHRVRALSPIEGQVYHYLKTAGWLVYKDRQGNDKRFSPSTIYRWVLAGRVPRNLRDKLMRGEINQTAAIKMARESYGRLSTNRGVAILDMVAESIEKMATKMEQMLNGAENEVFEDLNGVWQQGQRGDRK